MRLKHVDVEGLMAAAYLCSGEHSAKFLPTFHSFGKEVGRVCTTLLWLDFFEKNNPFFLCKKISNAR